MSWAEEVGLGELGLMPDQFWSLTFSEFHIKHAAFSRAEDRRRSLVAELALLIGNYKPATRSKLERRINALRRYPVKPWLRGKRGATSHAD